jgi:uncharacterized protein
VEQAAFDPTPPPPDHPELPEGAPPRWPPWYAGVGFLVALVATQIAVVIVLLATGTTDSEDDPAFTAVATFIQGAIFIGTAVLFASFSGKPRAEQFGLRPAKFWPTVRWAAIGLASFYVLAALYGVIVQPDTEQTVAQDLGADEGMVGQIAAGFMIVCIAPIAEEFFFRGFFYRALRSRYSVLVAALIDGLVFGVIHWDFSTASNLLIIPPLAGLGVMFCLVYERTGSLYPVIALHALNNAIAFGVTIHDPGISLVLGPLMLVACTLVPRAQRQRPAMA